MHTGQWPLPKPTPIIIETLLEKWYIYFKIFKYNPGDNFWFYLVKIQL